MPLQHFHPTVQRWFLDRIGEPSAPQIEGWPRIRSGRHTLIAAPTGTGKTLAAFLWAIDELLRQGERLQDRTEVLYVSPLKALGNDVQKNLDRPLAELRALDPALPEVRVLVRTGDTPQSQRAAMLKRPPHILVTTPESLYILLTSERARAMLSSVRTVILDEIHAVAGDKRGAHLALSIERLEVLVRDTATQRANGAGREALQRIGLSATQKPVGDVAHLLVGTERACEIVDVGHRRDMEVAIEIPDAPLETVCSTETWEEIITRMAELIGRHRTTLVFVNTRKLAERVAGKLTKVLGEDQVTSHHGSLSRERRLEAEARLKQGKLRALVATASLELGIDIGEVDLVIQAGITPSFAVFLQRIGRSGHALSRTPRGRLFPLTQDELVCAAAILDGIRRGELDRTPQPGRPLDILAQQIVAACVTETWDEPRLFETFRRAWPYRDLARDDFDSVVALLTDGRGALIHRDGVHLRLRATKRARIVALTSGGAIPDTGQYRVLLEPEATHVGTLDEDFAIESNVGDIFQLGNASWRILKVEPGVVRVADAHGMPPNVPFWFGEAPARTPELSASVARIRVHGRDPEWLKAEVGLSPGAATQLSDYLIEGERSLGAIPTTECVVLERFFDESGGMQLVIHAPFGGRMNRAWGLALRKRFCRGFGFELQAAANEEAIVLSLGLQHSFPLEDVFDYLHPDRAEELLVQALLAAPMFGARWRWNLTRALLLPRTQNGRRVPTPLIRMRAEDQLAKAFPQVLACPETLPPGETPVPWEHPLVRQTIEDCLTEAMDVEGFLEVLRRMRDGRIRKVAVDTTEPSAFARSILNAAPYAFLDDAPLEERRTQAVMARRSLDPKTVDTLGALDPEAVAQVREQAWPAAENAEEVHEALLWMGYVTEDEAKRSGWGAWLEELAAEHRVARETADPAEGPRFHAVEASRDEKAVLRGRLEALGPVFVAGRETQSSEADTHGITVLPAGAESVLAHLEADGVVMRCRIAGRQAWCERRLLARIHRQTLERLRREIEPVSATELWRFLACWQHAAEGFRLEGPQGVLEVARKLAGFEIPAAQWESGVLAARVRGYRIDWLDQLTLSGDLVWGRLWGRGNTAIRSTPLCLLPREDLDTWRALAEAAEQGGARTVDPRRIVETAPEDPRAGLSAYARAILEVIASRGASFAQELQRAAGLLPAHFEMGLTQLIGHGLVSCDSFGGVRRLITPPSRRGAVMRHQPLTPAGRWSPFRPPPGPRVGPPAALDETMLEFVARQLLMRTGVVFRALIERERLPVPWRDLVRVYRHWELRGDVRGGRFVQRFAGEQYALSEAVELMRRLRRLRATAEGADSVAHTRERRLEIVPVERLGEELGVSAADPLNLEGILTPDARISAQTRRRVQVG